MADLTLPYPNFVSGTTIVSQQVDDNNDAIADFINDRNNGVTSWTAVYVSSSATVPVSIVSSGASTTLAIDNTAADGDPTIAFKLSGSTAYILGVDDSDTDKFKIAHATALGTAASDDLIINASTGAVAIRGSATNDSGATGFLGEYVESVVSNVAFPATGVYGDATSISLTAGDWDVTASVFASFNGGTFTDWSLGISTTSGNSSSGLVNGSNLFGAISPATASTNFPAALANYRISLSATTTVYMKYRATWVTTAPSIFRRLSARRVR